MQRQSFGLAVILSLIALRVGIGMHFFREGINKVRDPKPFSAGFLGAAKGPFAESFHNRAWDRDGLARLDSKATIEDWDQFRAQVEQHYGFDEKQKQRSADLQKRFEDQLQTYFETKAGDIDEYRNNLARRDRYQADPQRMEVPSLRDQVDKIEREIRTKRNELVAPINLMWQGYVRELNLLASSEQRRQGPLALDMPGRRLLDSESIDKIIPWFDLTIGALLITGLATRPAAIVAMAFLCSVIASQWPTSVGADATWPQFIEVLGLFVVAAIGAGRFAGIDGLISSTCCRTSATAASATSNRAGPT